MSTAYEPNIQGAIAVLRDLMIANSFTMTREPYEPNYRGLVDAVIDLKEGLVPHIQIHDELDYSIFNQEQAEIVIDRMVNCVKMRVPLVVDYESGSNWGEAE